MTDSPSLQRIRVIYGSHADSDTQLGATNLGKSLIAIESTFNRANAIINPDYGELTLVPVASNEGSFEIEFIANLLRDPAELQLLTSVTIPEIRGLMDAILGDQGAVKALRWLKNRAYSLTFNESDSVEIVTDDGRFKATGKAVKLIESETWREGLVEITDAISDSRESVTINDNHNPPLMITKSDRDSFEVPEDDDIDEAEDFHEETMILKIVAPSFDANISWQLRNEDDHIHPYGMKDTDFQRKAESDLRFSGSDQLKCRVKITDRGMNRRPRFIYAITRVIEYHPGRQPRLFD